jgi:hypothetical protein
VALVNRLTVTIQTRRARRNAGDLDDAVTPVLRTRRRQPLGRARGLTAQILALIDTSITDARTEATNLMVKDAARIAFGFPTCTTSAAGYGCTASKNHQGAGLCGDNHHLRMTRRWAVG